VVPVPQPVRPAFDAGSHEAPALSAPAAVPDRVRAAGLHVVRRNGGPVLVIPVAKGALDANPPSDLLGAVQDLLEALDDCDDEVTVPFFMREAPQVAHLRRLLADL
jgi:hypothetical protein